MLVGYVENWKFQCFFSEKKLYIYYVVKYPARDPVFRIIIGQISGQISIRYNPRNDLVYLFRVKLFQLLLEVCDFNHAISLAYHNSFI